MIKKISYNHLFFISLLLFIPAYFINLGLLPFIDDEGIRGLVALEMKLSKDFITPTLSGALYFKKPPLYNWIISIFFEISNRPNEFWLRFPAVLCIFLFTLSIYFTVRKELGNKIAVFASLMFMTCGRIMIYESLHGLIDICFSWITYLSFMSIYYLHKKEKFTLLFITVYLITSITYLLKGLPAIVFTGTSLLVFFIWKNNFKILFSWKHFIGIAIFLCIVGGYYFIYFSKNNIDIHNLFSVIWGESVRRTGVRFGLLKTVIHLFTFPFEQIFHFLPWTLFVVFLFRKDFYTQMIKNDFVFFNGLFVVFNILPYWISVEVYPRYILMLVPMIFTVFMFFYENRVQQQFFLDKILVNILFPFIIIAGVIFSIVIPFVLPFVKTLDFYVLKIILLTSVSVLLLFIYRKRADLRVFLFIIFVFVFRLGFNWFILPKRHATQYAVVSREKAKEIGKKYKGSKLYTYWNPKTEPHPYYGKIITQYNFLFYITSEYDGILYQKSELEKGAVYMVAHEHFNKTLFEAKDTILPKGNKEPVYISVPK